MFNQNSMQNKLDKFENNLKSIVEDFMPNYSSKAWSKLDRSLPVSYAKWYLVASSVVIIAASFFTYQYINSNKQIHNNPTDKITENINTNLTNVQQSETLEAVIKDKENKNENNKVSYEKELIKPVLENKILLLDNEKKPILANADIDILVEEEELFETDGNVKIIEEKIQKEPVIYLSTHKACMPLLLDIAVRNLPLDAVVNWTISDGFKTKVNRFKHAFTKAGLYKITVEIRVLDKLILLEDELLVYKSPTVDFEYFVDNGQIEIENKSKNYEDLSWTFLGVISKDENPNFKLKYSGDYKIELAVENEYGCVSSLSKSINYIVDHHIFAPNAFSPDGDGINDAFLIKYESRDGYKYTFQIFNSKGQKLFETQNKYLAWKAENINLNIHQEKFTWRLIITDPRGVTETYKDFFVNISQ